MVGVRRKAAHSITMRKKHLNKSKRNSNRLDKYSLGRNFRIYYQSKKDCKIELKKLLVTWQNILMDLQCV